jgi:hypothetical protein
MWMMTFEQNSVFTGLTGREKRIGNWSGQYGSQYKLGLITVITNSSLQFGGGGDST